jgi:hypothetical protein
MKEAAYYPMNTFLSMSYAAKSPNPGPSALYYPNIFSLRGGKYYPLTYFLKLSS